MSDKDFADYLRSLPRERTEDEVLIESFDYPVPTPDERWQAVSEHAESMVPAN